ncbi:MAG TPA: ABC transporter permease [Candidatus Avoscillospira avistercoris]|uniref:ABC transporter permease n=1 Tax=Candidatus Avoscillospira avistercoris TaxID=2840707 RepID=A0A9D1F8T3_9FIRM|nr:ABC transporter permease [Candidatus Avoscillospira avistercoris]
MRLKKKTLPPEMTLGIFVVAIIAVLCLVTSDFGSVNNLMSVLNRFSYILIASIGMNIIMITGNIDVSFGGVISVMAILMAAIGKTGAPIYVFMPAAMVCGAILCTINALLITKLKIPAIVATLATTQIYAGALPLVVEGSIYDLPASFTWLAFEAKIFTIVPLSVLMALVILAISLYMMKYSRFFKSLYAIGNNAKGARLAGINVDRTIILTYAIGGALLGIAATIIATAGQRVTTTMGAGMEMTFIAAVVVGGTSVTGGSGNLLGTAFGALLLSIISPALYHLGVSDSWSTAVMGAIIIIAVTVSAMKGIRTHKTGAKEA